MPAIPRKEDCPMDWQDYDSENFRVNLDRANGESLLYIISEQSDTGVSIGVDPTEVESFLEWFNTEVKRVYGIE